MTAGYSGTHLAKKLGIKDGQKTWRLGMPASVASAIANYGLRPNIFPELTPGIEMAHLFVTDRIELAKHLAGIKSQLATNGMIWVSWPKKAAKVPTDISEDTIRAEAFPLDLVDIKVCAIDEIWSGLKLVIRRNKRDKRDG